jgi:phospholipase/lecithinase/hemolysin
MKVLFTLFALLLSSLVHSKSLNNMIIFGDSLSDNGNLYKLYQIPTSPPYYKGRFSNGPVWAEVLAESYFHDKANDHLQDYAFGGAAIAEEDNDDVFSLQLEIATYLGAHQDKADENSLFVIWIGANNYLMTPPDVDGTLANVSKGIKSGIQSLIKAGAKHIMLVNLPDLGVAPFPKELYSEEEIPAIREKLSSYCRRHNELLLETVTELKQSHPEIQWLHFDAGSKFKEFLDSPENYGISNTQDACYLSKADKITKNSMVNIAAKVKLKSEPGSCEGYFFFDGVHPTGSAHKIIAEHAKAYLDAEGVEFGA